VPAPEPPRGTTEPRRERHAVPARRPGQRLGPLRPARPRRPGQPHPLRAPRGTARADRGVDRRRRGGGARRRRRRGPRRQLGRELHRADSGHLPGPAPEPRPQRAPAAHRRARRRQHAQAHLAAVLRRRPGHRLPAAVRLRLRVQRQHRRRDVPGAQHPGPRPARGPGGPRVHRRDGLERPHHRAAARIAALPGRPARHRGGAAAGAHAGLARAEPRLRRQPGPDRAAPRGPRGPRHPRL
ncbi:MAG: hypothetical protein AVDCRST_MAG54-3240, partial [uncultured Actinomycetospora sp.]